MENWHKILESTFLDIAIINWLYFSLGLIGTFAVQKIIMFLIVEKALKLARKTKTKIDQLFLEALSKPLGVFLLFIGFYFSIRLLSLPKKLGIIEVGLFLEAGLTFSTTFCITWLMLRLVEILRHYLEILTEKTETKLDDQLVPIVVRTIKILVFTMAIIIILQNLGFSVSSLLASLGIGGMALALASKDSVENFFGSIVVFSDRPFQLGDWIKVGDAEGTVEEVGFRSTRIRQFDNAVVTLPNRNLTSNPIFNFSQMKKRRIKFSLGISYDSSPHQVREVVSEIKNLISKDQRFNQDYHLVRFDEFGASSLNIFIYCFTNSTVWHEYLEVRESFLLSIMEICQKLKVEIAYPTQTLFLRNEKNDEK